MAFLNLEWTGNAGACWGLNCSPFCGDPCNFADGLECCVGWWCCGPCHLAKLYAKTTDINQKCNVEHFLPACCCGCIVCPLVRRNLRVGLGVGKNETLDLVGDFLLVWCCGPCALSQMLRATDKTDWNSCEDTCLGIVGMALSVCSCDCCRQE